MIIRSVIEKELNAALTAQRNAALREAAEVISKKRDAYVSEHGIYDLETGTTEFPGNCLETVNEWDELTEAILALIKE